MCHQLMGHRHGHRHAGPPASSVGAEPPSTTTGCAGRAPCVPGPGRACHRRWASKPRAGPMQRRGQGKALLVLRPPPTELSCPCPRGPRLDEPTEAARSLEPGGSAPTWALLGPRGSRFRVARGLFRGGLLLGTLGVSAPGGRAPCGHSPCVSGLPGGGLSCGPPALPSHGPGVSTWHCVPSLQDPEPRSTSSPGPRQVLSPRLGCPGGAGKVETARGLSFVGAAGEATYWEAVPARCAGP